MTKRKLITKEILKKKLIVSLDGMSARKALAIAKNISDLVWGFKVNDLLFTDNRIVKKLKRYGNVFADAKLYDIPNTVANSISRLSSAGANIITVHASGGLEMMKVAKKYARKSKIVAVTVLTSRFPRSGEVRKLALEAKKAEVDGIVCSGHELKSLRGLLSNNFISVVPGIRPKGSEKGDQIRVMTSQEALESGADYLVVGRPITEAKNPHTSVLRLLS